MTLRILRTKPINEGKQVLISHTTKIDVNITDSETRLPNAIIAISFLTPISIIFIDGKMVISK